ncbi:MAG: SDR family oxidoreductase [Candidatus Eremiobacteraeota bacterium]|nr:SDR family oxidoreductase [Candidatus Eremiobacteraeota bacterium]MBV8432928.1 SDR family oxidoreductase [Candidatus Eremiobacteraeota bacterium]
MKPGIVISGASSGIGAATALLLAEKGYTAFAGVRSDDDARRAAGLHANVRPILLDVTDQSSIERAVDDVSKSGVAIAGIVSNAGIAIGGPLERLPIAELRRQFEVNVFGAVALVQAFLPLLHGGRGRVVFVGSISGRLATPYIGPYSASKFALRALSDAMRIELAPAGIAVSLIEPGSVKTPIWGKGRKTAADMASQLGDRTREHYRAALERVVAITESEERDGMPVAVVSNAIVHALCARRPRAHYLLGGSARMGSVVAVLPPALRDRAIRASMRIP